MRGLNYSVWTLLLYMTSWSIVSANVSVRAEVYVSLDSELRVTFSCAPAPPTTYIFPSALNARTGLVEFIGVANELTKGNCLMQSIIIQKSSGMVLFQTVTPVQFTVSDDTLFAPVLTMVKPETGTAKEYLKPLLTHVEVTAVDDKLLLSVSATTLTSGICARKPSSRTANAPFTHLDWELGKGLGWAGCNAITSILVGTQLTYSWEVVSIHGGHGDVDVTEDLGMFGDASAMETDYYPPLILFNGGIWWITMRIIVSGLTPDTGSYFDVTVEYNSGDPPYSDTWMATGDDIESVEMRAIFTIEDASLAVLLETIPREPCLDYMCDLAVPFADRAMDLVPCAPGWPQAPCANEMTYQGPVQALPIGYELTPNITIDCDLCDSSVAMSLHDHVKWFPACHGDAASEQDPCKVYHTGHLKLSYDDLDASLLCPVNSTTHHPMEIVLTIRSWDVNTNAERRQLVHIPYDAGLRQRCAESHAVTDDARRAYRAELVAITLTDAELALTLQYLFIGTAFITETLVELFPEFNATGRANWSHILDAVYPGMTIEQAANVVADTIDYITSPAAKWVVDGLFDQSAAQLKTQREPDYVPGGFIAVLTIGGVLFATVIGFGIFAICVQGSRTVASEVSYTNAEPDIAMDSTGGKKWQ